jgi:hypothetical protein
MKGVPYTVGILRPGKPSLPRREDIAHKVGLIGARKDLACPTCLSPPPGYPLRRGRVRAHSGPLRGVS